MNYVKLPSGKLLPEVWLRRVTSGYAAKDDLRILEQLPLADLQYILAEWLIEAPTT